MATAAGPKSNGVALVPPNATSQLSYSGTPRGPDGITYPDDYVDKLRNPITRMQIFEEMGNDDAVHTGIDARRQEICAANWSLTTEDKSDIGTRSSSTAKTRSIRSSTTSCGCSAAARCSMGSARSSRCCSGATRRS
jgi:hypothetical protein